MVPIKCRGCYRVTAKSKWCTLILIEFNTLDQVQLVLLVVLLWLEQWQLWLSCLISWIPAIKTNLQQSDCSKTIHLPPPQMLERYKQIHHQESPLPQHHLPWLWWSIPDILIISRFNFFIHRKDWCSKLHHFKFNDWSKSKKPDSSLIW